MFCDSLLASADRLRLDSLLAAVDLELDWAGMLSNPEGLGESLGAWLYRASNPASDPLRVSSLRGQSLGLAQASRARRPLGDSLCFLQVEGLLAGAHDTRQELAVVPALEHLARALDAGQMGELGHLVQVGRTLLAAPQLETQAGLAALSLCLAWANRVRAEDFVPLNAHQGLAALLAVALELGRALGPEVESRLWTELRAPEGPGETPMPSLAQALAVLMHQAGFDQDARGHLQARPWRADAQLNPSRTEGAPGLCTHTTAELSGHFGIWLTLRDLTWRFPAAFTPEQAAAIDRGFHQIGDFVQALPFRIGWAPGGVLQGGLMDGAAGVLLGLMVWTDLTGDPDLVIQIRAWARHLMDLLENHPVGRGKLLRQAIEEGRLVFREDRSLCHGLSGVALVLQALGQGQCRPAWQGLIFGAPQRDRAPSRS